MKHLIMLGPHCLVYSAAMVLDCSPTDLWKEIGHDGTALWFPDQVGEKECRGIHIQEIIDCFISRGYSLTPICLNPQVTPDSETKPKSIFHSVEEKMARFKRLVDKQPAILIGILKSGALHAVASDGKNIYDPRGLGIDDFMTQEAWISNQINS